MRKKAEKRSGKKEEKQASDYAGYGAHFSQARLTHKMEALPRSAGRDILLKALLLKRLLRGPELPGWGKALVIGVLGYFILPFDALPDFTPLAGYVDDFAAMLLALAELDDYVTPDMKAEAEAALPGMLRG